MPPNLMEHLSKAESAAKLDPGRNITITGNDFSGGELKDNENNLFLSLVKIIMRFR